MTLSKTETAQRALKTSQDRVQKATDEMYRATVDLYLAAESHLELLQRHVGQEDAKTFDGFRLRAVVGGEEFHAWPGHSHIENVLHCALQEHRVIGRDSWTHVLLPARDYRIPAPKGASPPRFL